jgi:hypothetical protein
MAGWTKKRFQAEPVTESRPGRNLAKLQASLSGVVILALDVSGSMYGSRLEQARKGCHQFVKEAVGDGYSTGEILWHHGIDSVSLPEHSRKRRWHFSMRHLPGDETTSFLHCARLTPP